MQTNSEKKPRVFLDTSIQVARVLAAPEKRHQLEQTLAHTVQAYTSHYVFMEFQRTVIADFVYVHGVLEAEKDWGDAVAELASGQRTFRPRALARTTRILGETLKRSHLNLDKGLLYLATYLDYRLERQFWTHVVPLTDSINCDLVGIGVTLQSNRIYTVADRCRKEIASCNLPQFLAEQRTQLQKISRYLAENSNIVKNQPRLEKLLAKIIVDPKTALGQGSCWPLGDIIIALQIPLDCMIWTLDSDFKALCTALEVQFYRPTD